MTHLRYQLDDITMNRTEQNSIIIQDMYIVYGHNERLYTYNKQELHSEQTQKKRKERKRTIKKGICTVINIRRRTLIKHLE